MKEEKERLNACYELQEVIGENTMRVTSKHLGLNYLMTILEKKDFRFRTDDLQVIMH